MKRFIEWIINRFVTRRVTVDLSKSVYANCSELTLEIFEKCYVGGDLTALIKDGSTVPAEYLANLWEQLQTEYCDLSSDENFKSYLNKKSRELAILLKQNHVKLLISQLAETFDPAYVQALRDYGYREKKYPLDVTNLETYVRSLSAIHMSLAQDDMRLQELQRELSIHTERHRGTEVKEGYFDSMLVEIEKHIGFSLNKETLTVRKYCNYLNNLREHNKPKMVKDGK